MTSAFERERLRIMRVAAQLFAERGYHATGISELSQAAGHGRGALYRYIGSKEGLLYDICREQMTWLNESAAAIVDSGSPPAETLRQLAHALLHNIAQNREEWVVFFREYTAMTGRRRDMVVAARERYESYWRSTLEAGTRRGSFRALSPLLVKGLLGMFNYSYLWYDPEGEISSDELADLFVDTVLRGIAR